MSVTCLQAGVVEHPTPLKSKTAMRIGSLLNSSRQQSEKQEHQPVQSPEVTILGECIRQVLSTACQSVESIERLSCDVHLNYLLRLADGTRYVLKSGPAPSIRTMRREHHSLEDESLALASISRSTHLPIPMRIKLTTKSRSSMSQPSHLLRSYIPGKLLSEVWSMLSPSAQAHIDRLLGVYFLALTSITAKAFGTLRAVNNGRGSRTWREAFLAMLEAALRDAEDMLVSVPYDSIRYYVTTKSAVLDEIVTPKLTALNACQPDKVLVDRDTLQITGLIGFGDVVWGDPAMASVMADPSIAFLDSYGRCATRLTPGSEDTRRSMYGIYRALVAIVKHHYRPCGSEDDIEARVTLDRELSRLAHA